MNRTRLFSLFLPFAVYAQGTLADYQRAGMLRARYQAAALNIPETPSWLDKGRFWYRKSVAGGHEFVMVDASTGAKAPAFDHEKLAASLSKAANASYTAVTLPFNTISFVDHDQAIEVAAFFYQGPDTVDLFLCDAIVHDGLAGAGIRRGDQDMAGPCGIGKNFLVDFFSYYIIAGVEVWPEESSLGQGENGIFIRHLDPGFGHIEIGEGQVGTNTGQVALCICRRGKIGPEVGQLLADLCAVGGGGSSVKNHIGDAAAFFLFEAVRIFSNIFSDLVVADLYAAVRN